MLEERGTADADPDLHAGPLNGLIRSTTLPPPESDAYFDQPENSEDEANVLIEGLLAKGDLAIISGPSKSNKSWLSIQCGVCVANGMPFWDRKTRATKVLIVNFELKRESFARRLQRIGRCLEILDIGNNLTVWNLRNSVIDEQFLAELNRLLTERGIEFVILDPLYAMLGKTVENSNSEMTQLLSEIRRRCEKGGAACWIVHHTAKGNAAERASIDRGAGAGALGRFPDAVLSMVPHEQERHYVIELDLRDFAPIEPFVVRSDFPLMVLTPNADPSKVRRKTAPNAKGSVSGVCVVLAGRTIPEKDFEHELAGTWQCNQKTAKRWVEKAIHEGRICRTKNGKVYPCESTDHPETEGNNL